MMMLAWYILVFGWFYTQNGARGQCPAYAPNIMVKHGWRMYGHVMTWLYAEEEVLCRLKCNLNEKCLTFNYEEKTKICELNDDDDERHLQKTQGFIYVDVKKIKKSAVSSTNIAPAATRPGIVASTSTTPTTSISTIQSSKTSTGISTTHSTSAISAQPARTILINSITPTSSYSSSAIQPFSRVTSTSAIPPTTRPGPCKQGVKAIGMQNRTIISDHYITDSKHKDTAKHARLNDAKGWKMTCTATEPCSGQWLQVNVGKISKIIAIATQGAYSTYTKTYTLSYSNDSIFTTYTQIFEGNADCNTTVHNDLIPAITARYVRVSPTEDNDNSGVIALRMELYECKEYQGMCSYALGMQSRMITNSQLNASSSDVLNRGEHLPSNARLNHEGSAWMPEIDDTTNPWLQIDLLQVKKINGIATQGFRMDYVKQYHLQYRNTAIETFNNYSTEDVEPMTLSGNSDTTSIVYNALNPPIVAQIVRIRPTAWDQRIAMRIELYGCPYKGFFH